MPSNATTTLDLPPLPSYSLMPLPSIVPGIPDYLCQLLLPIIAYWATSIVFHVFDTYEIFSQYRLHTPAEVLKRNHVSRYEVIKDVILQQIIQTFFGLLLAMMDPVVMTGKQTYDIMNWARTVRKAQRILPSLFAVFGLDSAKLGRGMLPSYPIMAGILNGGHYPQLTVEVHSEGGQFAAVPTFANWEILAAKLIYWFLIPAVQFGVAIFIVDTWQYFLHRAMHMNKWLYTTLHSRHHRLYVPYAFGALYNHPVEGFLLDTLGTGLAYLVTGMSIRQGMCFFTCSTIKTVDDHCGYAFPWDPLQHLTSNNAAYHDVHHQSWGIKTNFSQPFFTFWDRILGTAWSGGDVSERYERSRIATQKKIDAESNSMASSVTRSPAIDVDKAAKQAAASQQQVLDDKENGGPQILMEERSEEQDARQASSSKSPRRKTASFDPKGDSLRGLRDRVTGSLHSRSTAILHADGRH